MGSTRGVQLWVGADPHTGVDPISVGHASVYGAGEGSFDGCSEVGCCVAGGLGCSLSLGCLGGGGDGYGGPGQVMVGCLSHLVQSVSTVGLSGCLFG